MGMKNNEKFLASNPKPASVVFDKGRRGNPLPGCDCVQCFGYCFIDGDKADRDRYYRKPRIEDTEAPK